MLILEQTNTRTAQISLEAKLLQSNYIFLCGEIDTDMITECQCKLMYITSIINKTVPIKICINSPGGSVYDCLGLYDLIQFYIKKGYIIETLNMGKACSAAAIIAMSGSPGHRYAFPNSTFLLHQPSSGTIGTVTDMTIELEECQRLKLVLEDIVRKHASSDLIPYMERDKYISVQEALKYNIIDAIKQ